MVIIVMGVTAAGKTTVGTALAAKLGWRFVEGDQLHPPANVAKMHAGIALSDADRAPWLAGVHAIVSRAIERREHLVVACSALRERYREILRGSLPTVRFVLLKVPEEVAVARAAQRTGHFAGPELVPSQFAALEIPSTGALTIDATLPPDRVVAVVLDAFGLGLPAERFLP
jgi:gluconokinase